MDIGRTLATVLCKCFTTFKLGYSINIFFRFPRIINFFYKNIVQIGILWWFQIYDGWSGN